MDVYNDSLLLFWESLNRNGVKYIMVGGFAVTCMVTCEQQRMPTCGLKTLWKTDRIFDMLLRN